MCATPWPIGSTRAAPTRCRSGCCWASANARRFARCFHVGCRPWSSSLGISSDMVDAPPLGDLLGQRFAIRGRVWRADEAGIQAALDEVHGTSERPRCLCRAGGVAMYVARLQEFIVKRMPDSGHLHHPSCPSFESKAAQSGLGALTGSAVRELETGRTELRVDFPWIRRVGRSAKPAIPMPSGQVEADRKSTRLNSSHHSISYAVF